MQAYIDLAMAMAITGSSVVIGKLVIASFPVFLGAALRFGIASAVLFPLLLIKEKELPRATGKDWLNIFLQTLSGSFLFSVFLLYGLKYTNAAEGGIITSTTPAVLGLISFLFLREKLTGYRVASIVFTLCGILVINLVGKEVTSVGNGLAWLGNILVFGAVVGEALFTIFRKKTSKEVSPLAGAALVSSMAFAMFLPFAIPQAMSFNFHQVRLADWLPVFYYGIVVTVIGFNLWFRGVEKVDASTAAVFTGVWPVSALLLSYLILKEQFIISHLAGIICIMFGIAFTVRDSAAVRSVPPGKDSDQLVDVPAAAKEAQLRR